MELNSSMTLRGKNVNPKKKDHQSIRRNLVAKHNKHKASVEPSKTDYNRTKKHKVSKNEDYQ